MSYTIMVIDDEQMILDMLRDQFEMEQYQVITAKSSEEALQKLNQQPDIILLDINMPGMDGLELCRAIRDHVACPILFLTARIEEADRVAGLRAGGDDYILKPFSLAELTARVEAHLRRESRIQQKISVRGFGDIVVDYAARTVSRNGQPIELSKVEFDIVELLSLHPGQVFSRERLIEQVWGYAFTGETRTVDVHIRTLRQKLGPAGAYIQTVRGYGYKIDGEG